MMINNHKFANWVTADITNIKINKPKLYPRSWMLKQCQKEGCKESDFECYDIPGTNVLLYKFKDEIELDPKQFPKYHLHNDFSIPEQEKKKMIEEAKENYVETLKKIQRNVILEEEIKKLYMQNNELQMQLDEKNLHIEKQNDIINGLLNKNKEESTLRKID